MAAFVDTSHEIKPEHVKRAGESIGIRVGGESARRTLLYAGVGGLLIAGALLVGAGKLMDYLSLKSAQSVAHVPAKVMGRQDTQRSIKAGERVVVSVPMLNMREAPDPNSSVVYVLREGDELRVLEEGPETWVKVLFSDGEVEVEGWVNGKYVR